MTARAFSCHPEYALPHLHRGRPFSHRNSPKLTDASCFERASVRPAWRPSQDGEVRYCQKCNQYKPPRSHHCRVCDRCVLRMDHHCVWINNCVGHNNYRAFLLFLICARAAAPCPPRALRRCARAEVARRATARFGSEGSAAPDFSVFALTSCAQT